MTTTQLLLKKPFNSLWLLKSVKNIIAVNKQKPERKKAANFVLYPKIINIGANISNIIAGYMKKAGRSYIDIQSTVPSKYIILLYPLIKKRADIDILAKRSK